MASSSQPKNCMMILFIITLCRNHISHPTNGEYRHLWHYLHTKDHSSPYSKEGESLWRVRNMTNFPFILPHLNCTQTWPHRYWLLPVEKAVWKYPPFYTPTDTQNLQLGSLASGYKRGRKIREWLHSVEIELLEKYIIIDLWTWEEPRTQTLCVSPMVASAACVDMVSLLFFSWLYSGSSAPLVEFLISVVVYWSSIKRSIIDGTNRKVRSTIIVSIPFFFISKPGLLVLKTGWPSGLDDT